MLFYASFQFLRIGVSPDEEIKCRLAFPGTGFLEFENNSKQGLTDHPLKYQSCKTGCGHYCRFLTKMNKCLVGRRDRR